MKTIEELTKEYMVRNFPHYPDKPEEDRFGNTAGAFAKELKMQFAALWDYIQKHDK